MLETEEIKLCTKVETHQVPMKIHRIFSAWRLEVQQSGKLFVDTLPWEPKSPP